MQDGVAANGPNGAAATFYCAASGAYASTHPPVRLPADPSLSLVPHIFARAPAAAASARPALVDAATGEALSLADLRRLVAALAAGLRRRAGLRAGDAVLLVLPNSVAFPVAFLAVLAAGGVATAMSPSSAPAEIAARVRDTSPALVLAAPENAGSLPPLRLPVVLVPETFRAAGGGAPEFAPFRALLLHDPGAPADPPVGQDDAAAILYSSGTGGRSKGVVLTHRNLIATVELFVRFEASQYAAPACGNVYLAALPMFHVYGLSLFAVGLLSLGTMVVVMKRFDVRDAVKAIDRFRVTHFPLVPPIMAALVHAVQPPALRSLVQGYGMTESAAVATRGFNTSKQKKYASVGLLAPNMHARIVDLETGCYLPPGSCGELWLHGPAIMRGYLNDDDAHAINDGWLRTGDVAYFDSDGYLYIVGRLKEVIKYKGFQIAPADLEAVLVEHPEIVDVAVTSAEDEEAGEIPVAFVVRRSGSSLSCTQVMEYVAKQVSAYKKVRRVVFVESIPRSPAGKVLRRLLKDSLAAANAVAAGPTSYSKSNSKRRSRL
ncbi:4-coumarate--CoA ligase-like 3 [Panicum miliaceum]|uniref:4-coumarate--CoA ligase n=1 Tax=Panicum miliaceum TaxID=4540 RepID=A0A3L6TJC9_PANMI|nr:4-coumarate--CoA ligase-like 3 [Panicum miliaceum]